MSCERDQMGTTGERVRSWNGAVIQNQAEMFNFSFTETSYPCLTPPFDLYQDFQKTDNVGRETIDG